MGEFGFVGLFALPAGLGLLGFVEPCSIGASLLFIKYLEGKSAAEKLAQTALFTATRGAFIGALGILAVALGAAFVGLQKGAWVLLGIAYLALGMLLFTGRAKALAVAIGPRLAKVSGMRGSAGLGLLFGLNIPACAAPLLAALLGAAAAGGTTGATAAAGFVSLGVFGVALSAPLVAAVFSAQARRALDALAHSASRFPKWAGVVLIVLGAWSIRYGLFVDVPLG